MTFGFKPGDSLHPLIILELLETGGHLFVFSCHWDLLEQNVSTGLFNSFKITWCANMKLCTFDHGLEMSVTRR